MVGAHAAAYLMDLMVDFKATSTTYWKGQAGIHGVQMLALLGRRIDHSHGCLGR